MWIVFVIEVYEFWQLEISNLFCTADLSKVRFSCLDNFVALLPLNEQKNVLQFPHTLYISGTCIILPKKAVWIVCFVDLASLHSLVNEANLVQNNSYQVSHKYSCFSCWWAHYLLTRWCTVLLEKVTGLRLVKKFSTFHGTQRFITALTSIRHLSLSWASPIQSIYPHPTSWRSVLILSTHLRLVLLTHMHHMPSPSHSSRFYHRHNIGWGVQII